MPPRSRIFLVERRSIDKSLYQRVIKMHFLEQVVSTASAIIWPVFLPILLVSALYIGIKMTFKVRYLVSRPSKLSIKNMVGPISISLGAMIGTGAIIGVLGSLANLYGSGQIRIESITFWALIGALILVPLSYAETIVAKVTNTPPDSYLNILVRKGAGKFYAIAFIALYIFGFGGFQFSGIDTAITLIGDMYFGIELHEVQRYLFIVIPIILIVTGIILSKKHHIFINAMTYMIGTAVVLYFIFFTIFLMKTTNYFPIFFANMWDGVMNPTNALLGIPTGLILGLQRIIQTSETGLGALGMASLESKSKPREAAFITLIPTVITIFVAIFVTTYITSYGIYVGEFNGDAMVSGVARLGQFFNTATVVTGNFGLGVMILFTILSALTTLLGSYFFLDTLLELSENKQILIYTVLIVTAGTLAIFGFDIIFEVVDLLLCIIIGLNVYGLFNFVNKYYKKYTIDKEKAE